MPTVGDAFQDRMELRRLVEEYAIAGDNFDNARYGLLFTEDASFTATAPGATDDEYVRTTDGWRCQSRRIEFTSIERTPVDNDAFAAWTAK